MAPRNDSFFKRLTTLFKSGPSIQRRVKGYDYKNYYDNDLIRGNYGYRAPFPFGREASPFSVLGAYGILDRMSRYSEFCFHPSTLIYTTKGAFTIKELAEKYPSGERFQVYSYDQNTKEILVADAHHPRMTKDGTEQQLVKITFDDGGSITTTPDHKVMLREGWYEKAEDLKIGDSLMPFHVKDTTGTGYKHIYTINKKGQNKYGWTPEHNLVAENLLGRRLLPEETVHHIDFNPANNMPKNLKVMLRLDHQNFHASLNNRNKFGKPNKKHSTWMRENNPVKRNDIAFDIIFDTANKLDFSMAKTMKTLLVDQNVLKRRLREAGFTNWIDFKDNRGLLTTIRNASVIIGEMNAPEISEIVEKCKECRTISDASSILKCSDNAIRRRLEAHGYGTWTEFKNNATHVDKEKRKGILDEAISYQDICSVYQPGMTAKAIAKKLNCTFNQVKTRIEREGYKSFGAWKLSYKNHKVANVEWVKEKSCVYNLTVDGYHNLAAGSQLETPVMSKDGKSTSRVYSMVIVKQSEMEYTPEIAAALNIFADESVAGDEKGNAFHLYTRNPEVKRALEELFYDILNIDFNLRPWVRNLVKYGDFFLYNEVVPDIGVVTVQPIPVNELEREEGFDPEDPYAVRFKWLTRGNRYLENWQITHMRMLGNDLFLPYGTSLLEPARRIWRQLLMMEDAMLVYRVVRSPERRVFYIDVGNVAPNDVPSYMEACKQTLRSNNVVDRTTGRVDQRYNPVSIDEDYFIPIRGSQTGTKIDTLAGGQNATATEDVEYLQKKLFAAIQVPKSYLNFTENLSAKASMAQLDIRFSRTIAVIQRIVIAELNKLAMIHLYTKGFDGEDLIDFELKLSNPSTVAAQQKLEVLSTKFDIAGKARDTTLCDDEWIQKQVLDLSEDEIIKIEAGRRRDKIRAVEIEAIAVQENLPQKNTMADPFDRSNYTIPGAEVKKNPMVSLSSTLSPVEKQVQGTSQVNKPGSYVNVAGGTPIKVTPFLTAVKRKQKRQVGWSGKGAVAMPDFKAMLDAKRNRSLTDTFDIELINNKASIAEERSLDDLKSPSVLPNEMKSIFGKLNKYIKTNYNRLLKEEIDLTDIGIIGEEQVMDLMITDEDVLLETIQTDSKIDSETDEEIDNSKKDVDLSNLD